MTIEEYLINRDLPVGSIHRIPIVDVLLILTLNP